MARGRHAKPSGLLSRLFPGRTARRRTQLEQDRALVRQLRDTVVDGDNAFLKTFDPAKAHTTLVDDRFARNAIKAAGGPAKFGLAESLTRTERVAP